MNWDVWAYDSITHRLAVDVNETGRPSEVSLSPFLDEQDIRSFSFFRTNMKIDESIFYELHVTKAEDEN